MASLGHGVELTPVLSRSACDAIVAATRDSEAWRDAPVYLREGEPQLIDAVRRARVLDERDAGADATGAIASLKRRVETIAGDTTLQAGDAQIVRYDPGGHFALHQDATASPREWRRRSAVVYLNDGFRGGATCFPALGMRVEPRAGHALTFPPPHAHYAEPVTEGTKLVVVFWLGPHGVSPAG